MEICNTNCACATRWIIAGSVQPPAACIIPIKDFWSAIEDVATQHHVSSVSRALLDRAIATGVADAAMAVPHFRSKNFLRGQRAGTVLHVAV